MDKLNLKLPKNLFCLLNIVQNKELFYQINFVIYHFFEKLWISFFQNKNKQKEKFIENYEEIENEKKN